MKTVNNFIVKNKKVLLRVDLNVPLINGFITDKSRIISIKSTIFKLQKTKNKIFLISHFGRPRGKYIKKYSLKFICNILKDEFNVEKIYFISSIDKKEIQSCQRKMNKGDICLIENIRFYPGEEKNDLNFAKQLSECFDVYINEAFSASHRKHASIVRITNYLPSLAGDHFMKEIKNLDMFLSKLKKPTTAIIGGSKVSTKLSLLENLVKYSDNIIIAGAMANTFLLAQDYNIGKSLVEKNMCIDAKEILKKAKKNNCTIILPVDVVCSKSLNDLSNIKHNLVKEILPNQMILDIGNKSIKIIKKILLKSNMILWNGPLGAFEHKPFDYATNAIVDIIKKNAKKLKITSIAGGGDTLSAIKNAKAEKSFTYISNAGGAFLEWLEGKESPGVKALKKNQLS